MHPMINSVQWVPVIWWDEKNVVDGENAKLVDRIQKRYDYDREEAQREAEDYFGRFPVS
jgi:hypothetical protein